MYSSHPHTINFYRLIFIMLFIAFSHFSFSCNKHEVTPNSKGSTNNGDKDKLPNKQSTDPDIEKFNKYKQAADNGDIEAQFELARMYHKGIGTEKNHKKAVKLFQHLAEQGHAGAQNGLGCMYSMGLVDDMYDKQANDRKVFEWFHKSAEQGWGLGQCNLAKGYLYGEGVAKDHQAAAFWLEKAINNKNINNGEPEYLIGFMFQNGYISSDYTKEYNDSEAVEFFINSASKGYVLGQYSLGYMYFYGYGRAKDHKRALKWFIAAAKQGDIRAERFVQYLCTGKSTN